MDTLPIDLIWPIFSFLKYTDRKTMAIINRLFAEIWKSKKPIKISETYIGIGKFNLILNPEILELFLAKFGRLATNSGIFSNISYKDDIIILKNQTGSILKNLSASPSYSCYPTEILVNKFDIENHFARMLFSRFKFEYRNGIKDCVNINGKFEFSWIYGQDSKTYVEIYDPDIMEYIKSKFSSDCILQSIQFNKNTIEINCPEPIDFLIRICARDSIPVLSRKNKEITNKIIGDFMDTIEQLEQIGMVTRKLLSN